MLVTHPETRHTFFRGFSHNMAAGRANGEVRRTSGFNNR